MDNTDYKKIIDEYYRKNGFENDKKTVELNPMDETFTEALTKKLIAKQKAKAELIESIRAYGKLLDANNEDNKS
ncbi:MAG: hypothetical protein AB8G11_15465 [Saprospiraceae bacterium]